MNAKQKATHDHRRLGRGIR